MSSIVQNMLQKSVGDGARATKFQILFEFTNQNSAPNANDMVALAKTTSFPGKSHSTIDFKYKGRSIPLRGQTKYTQTWECTFYLTEDHKLKNAFENWIEALDEKHNYMDVSTIAGVSATQRIHNSGKYTTTIVLYQRNFDDDQDTAVYHLHNVFPIEVSPIQYSYEQQGQIQEFTVTFAYSYFTMNVMKGRAGNFIDSLVDKWKEGATGLIQDAMNKVADGINGFIKDAAGDALNKLNDWAGGLTKDIIPGNIGSLAKDLVSGGLPTQFMGAGVLDSIASSAGKSISMITNAAQGAVDDAIGQAKALASNAINDATSAATSKVKSLIG